MIDIKVRIKDKIIILDITGQVDVNAAYFIEVVGQCLRDGYRDVLCNFDEVETIDYMGVSVLVIAYKDVTNHQGRFKCANIPAHLRNIISIVGLDKVLEMYPSEEAAVASFKEDRVIDNIKKIQLRRRFKRLPIDLKVELRHKYHKNPVCLKVEILDLSAVGAYIFSCDQFKLGDEVMITLIFPTSHKRLELEARVVWLSDKEIQRHIHPGMGVEFYNISTETQQELLKFIERNLSCI